MKHKPNANQDFTFPKLVLLNFYIWFARTLASKRCTFPKFQIQFALYFGNVNNFRYDQVT